MSLAISKRLKAGFKKSIIFFAMILVTLNGMLPSFANPVQAAEMETTEAIEQPNVSKDIEGEEVKEISTGEDYNYHVSVELPENISGYGSIEILDNLNKHLAVQGTAVLIDEEENDTYTVVVDGQKVSLELAKDELEELAGKEVKLQITTQVKEDAAATADKIENVAQIVINDDLIMETNPAVVTPIDLEEKDQMGPDELKEEKDQAESDELKEEENQAEPNEPKEENDKDVESDDQTSTKEILAAPLNQVQAVEGITINDTDSYSITSIDGAMYIIQYDGNNPSAAPKGKVKLDNPAINNSLALGKNEDVFYANAGANLYKIYPNGKTEFVTNLAGGTVAGAISPDGKNYVYFVTKSGELYIETVDLATKGKKSVPIQDKSGFANLGGGDLVFDADGNLWFSRWQDTPVKSVLAKVDVEKGILESVIPIVADNGKNFTRSGALSFLPNGKLLTVGIYSTAGTPYLFELDPATGIATELTAFQLGTTDFASRVYPSIKPDLKIEKRNDPSDTVFPGDTVTYTLKVTNTGTLASTLTKMNDDLPEGTSYVPGTTTLNGEKVADVAETSPIFTGMPVHSPGESLVGILYAGEKNAAVVTFQVKVNDGVQPGTEIKNIATVSGDSIAVISSNEVSNKVVGTPVLESEKSAKLHEKVDGNVDTDHPESGDTLVYTIQTRNTIENSSVKNLVISDTIPEGLEYVPGTLTVDDKKVSDEEDDDQGEFVDNKVTGKFGDVTDTEWHTITFQVKVKEGQAGKTIKNTATVTGDNLDKPDKPETSIVVYPLDPPSGVCGPTVALINGSFEGGPERGSYQNIPYMFLESEVPGWNTTDDSQGVKIIEIWDYKQGYPAGAVNNFPAPPDGNRYAELNAYDNGLLYQDVKTTPGQTIYWRLAHMGRQGVDTMQLRIGPVTNDPYDTPVIEQMSDGNTKWGTYTGTYTVPEGQTVTRFGFEAVSTAGGNLGAGNFLDDIFLGTEACITAEKSVSPEGDVFPGDELTYEVTVKNAGGDVASNTVIEDAIPEGTEYVPGSMKILSGPKKGDVTDEKDNDVGHYTDGKVTFNIGDLPNTNDLPDGVTVQFKVKALSDHAGKDVINKAQVKHKNLLTGKDEETETNETKTPIKYKDPVLKSEKSAVIKEKAEGNTDRDNPEVGDTLLYTIKTQNTNKDSLVKNLVISDEIPEGLEYVAGSLKVDDESVTDAKDDDKGHAVDGKISGQFGDIKGTDWHTLTFEVKVKAGQAGMDIKNIATVKGDNIDKPDEPEEEVKIYPREPKLESEKSATNAEKGKETFEVGDTIVYTIKTRNKVSDSLVSNLTIEDTLPAGLELIADSLKASHGGTVEENNGVITAKFGEVADTEWRTVTFEAKIKSGQSGKEIKNTAKVTVDEIEEPEEPTTTVKVDPKEPKLESKKSSKLEKKAEGNTDAKNPEVGDTIRYTITTKNMIADSLVKNLVITDTIPSGLSYVAGSLEVDGESVTDAKDEDAGHVVDGKVAGTIGDVTDTKEHTINFLVTVDKGQAGADIKNIATVKGENIDKPDEPEEEVKIYPREPKLEAEKSATNAEKGKETFEVGDTIIYTIKTRNKVSDSLVSNLTIVDTLPVGLELIADSLKANHGGTVEEKDGVITASFGDVKDTEWRTVTFEAKIKSGQSGKEIKNTAKVTVDEIKEPEEPTTTVKVDPKEPKLESKKSSKLEKKAEGNTDAKNPEVGDTIRYTITTNNTIEDSLVKDLVISDTIPSGLSYVAGSLEVDGKKVTDAKDDDAGHVVDGKVTGSFGDVTDTKEHTVTFLVTVDKGQSGKDIKNIAIVGGENTGDPDEPEEEVKIYPREPKLDSKKSSKLEKKAEGNTDAKNPEVGDTIRYTITTKNTIEDSLVKNLVISDTIPSGLSYVAGSLEVDGKKVTDAKDDDAGHVVDGKVTGSFGDVTDTKEHTVTFLVTVDKGQSGKDIKNIAVVGGENTGDPDEPEEEVKIYPREPKLEAEKSATNAEKGKETFEVGDTIIYTIKTRNKVSDSLVSNLMIEDTLPAGLELIADSLKASHGGTVEEKDGVITASFGDVKDTEWRIVTFKAKIKSGQSGKDIKNTAKVTVDEIEEPEEPTTTVKVDPKAPKLDSKKSSKLEKKAEGNTDAKNPEVGDTIRYTITTKNTIEDSLVENLVITDTIPSGLSYVAGSLEVDGKQVTDAKDEDAGHVVDGKVTGNFGDVTDTKAHTVSFLVTVDKGQSGKDIKNIAVVGGENIGDPDEPEEEVKIYPREPKLESEKSATNAEKGKEKFEVDDTIVYTIKTRNKVSDSLVQNLTITDKLPAGLEYVADSLKVSHEGTGDFKDGTVTATFGDVKDTEWRTITFQAKIKSGQSGKELKNIAVVDGDNIDKPDEPEEEVTVDPKDPTLQSEKSAKLEAKADGNKDKDNPEVGDTLLYTIKTKNKSADSLVKNLVISDEIPEGLEYVAGSLKVDGQSVTDAKDDDKGYAVDEKIVGQFGDIKDTNWHTVEFLVKVKTGQSGKDIKNIATVDGDNIDKPDKPEEEVQIHPRHSVLESEKSASNIEKGKEKFEVGDTIVYTIKTRNKVSDSLVQNLTITDKLPAGLEYVTDSLKVSHEGAGEFKDGAITATFGDVKDTEWRTVTFQAKIKSGQSGNTIENIAIVDGDNIDKPDEPEEEVTVDPKNPTLQSEKSAKLEAKAEGNKDTEHSEVGDTLRYTIKTQNTIEDSFVKNLVISDEIPEGLEYVADSLKVDGESVTDAKDDDKGYAVDGKIVGQFGNIKDTNWHTVEFLVKVKSGQAGKDIKNIAVVDGDNIDKPDKPEEVVQVYPRHSVLESEKLAMNLEKGKDTFKVGDTVVYTIKARNTVSDSLVENLKITDKLPAELEYVDGSLEVSHEGTGEFKDGTITANFGDVKDTEWRTVTFTATIQSDQSGETIKNIATVSSDNVPDSNYPEAKIDVDPKDPAPKPDPGVDNSGGKTPPSKTEKEEGKKLPNTATNIFNYGLLGVIIVIAGLLGLRRRKSS
ncbi:isopeptide-forming domain-containing fimbrial protein [Bacillus norwichensis]|uniref:Isopeptide-forming domain-containing fimbrial protein n=1 Tax=Bacillus norwichensis TaxID=2762217 RepID=A0ABR8VMW8_9BACI|nr:isopeptide-forming domain-containing fimbrial protein [Bacillus norwichensis]MBD8006103.1 isopeptide-forming domain-containing fimbrial protein [Bacillus norwichensis]